MIRYCYQKIKGAIFVDKWFPTMRDCPEGKVITLGALYWVVYLLFLPGLLTMMTAFMSLDDLGIMIFNVVYFVLNLLCVLGFSARTCPIPHSICRCTEKNASAPSAAVCWCMG